MENLTTHPATALRSTNLLFPAGTVFRAFPVQMPTQSEAGMFFVIPCKRSIAACLAVTHKQAIPRQKRGPQARGNPEGGSDCI
ncbi:MAG: hypothetical protein LBP58_04030, partial [Azoarcus sp.]|nr:hypothetical protein [Azoarcus sp.]